MRKGLLSVMALGIGLSMGSASAQGLPDLKVENVSIDPVPAGVLGPKLQLHMNRSYRFQVTIRNVGAGTVRTCFIVRTECVRQGKTFMLGEALVGQTSGPYIYAVYDVFPSSAGAGDCILRTIVDADQAVNEADKSPLSNIWDRGATVIP